MRYFKPTAGSEYDKREGRGQYTHFCKRSTVVDIFLLLWGWFLAEPDGGTRWKKMMGSEDIYRPGVCGFPLLLATELCSLYLVLGDEAGADDACGQGWYKGFLHG